MGSLLGRLFGQEPRDDSKVEIAASEVEALADRGTMERERARRAIGDWNREEGVIRRAVEHVTIADTLLRARDRGREEAR